MLQTHINIGIGALRLGKYGWWSIHRSVFDHIEILWCMYPSKTSMEKLPTGGQTSISDTWRKDNEWCLGTSRKGIHWQMKISYFFHRWLHLPCACTIFKGQGSSFWLHQRMHHTNWTTLWKSTKMAMFWQWKGTCQWKTQETSSWRRNNYWNLSTIFPITKWCFREV